jgi:hypothetical protein
MWVSRKEFQALQSEVNNLRYQLKDYAVIRTNEVELDTNRWKTIGLHEAVVLLLDHFGLTVESGKRLVKK